MKKNIIKIILFVVILCGLMMSFKVEASVGDYVDVDSVWYHKGTGLIPVRLRFTALQDFKQVWIKNPVENIMFVPSMSDFYYQVAKTDITTTGSGGFLVSADELNGIPSGSYEKWYYTGNTYDVFLTGWACEVGGCIGEYDLVKGDNMNEIEHYITLKQRTPTDVMTFYYSANPPIPPTPEHAYVSISVGFIDEIMSYPKELLADVKSPVAMVVGIPIGLWCAWQLIGLLGFRKII